MSLPPEKRTEIAHRLAQVCAEMDSLGKAPWSMRAEFLDRWMELFAERNELENLLGSSEDDS
jgi:hypothetical protein